jgi:hypothetical protein
MTLSELNTDAISYSYVLIDDKTDSLPINQQFLASISAIPLIFIWMYLVWHKYFVTEQ